MSSEEPPVELAVPAEPGRVAAAARASLRDGMAWQSCAGPAISSWLWDQWCRALEPAGLSRERFDAVCAGYRRELWLWLAGDRPWEQAARGLAGRLARRLPERRLPERRLPERRMPAAGDV